MKRLLVRMSALSLVGVLCLIAIARAQRSDSIDGAAQTPGDPFANSGAIASQSSGDMNGASNSAGNSASNSSVRMVGVQDVPSQSGAVPPRSVPPDQQSAGGPDLTIHQVVPTGGSIYTGGASLASAAAPIDAPLPSPPPSSGAHSNDLSPAPAAQPMQVAQAPSSFDPPASVAPLPPAQPAPPVESAPQAGYGGAAYSSPQPSGYAQQQSPASAVPQADPPQATAPQSPETGMQPSARANPAFAAQPMSQPAPQTAAEVGPVLSPIAQNQPEPPTTVGTMRPIEPASFSGIDPAISGVGAAQSDPKHVEGTQSPRLTIEKIAPREVQVGKQARFELRVRNIGSATADGVEVHDSVPQGMQFVASNPATTQGPDGQLAWSLGELKPGEQASVQLELMPIAEGDIQSHATVTFRTEVSVHTIATRPRLVVHLSAPKQVLIGDEATVTVQVSNPGTGAATGVVLSERVPRGLRHKAGGELEFDVGTLRPGQSRQIELSMSAVEAGHVVNMLQAHGDGQLHAQSRIEFDVVAPALSVAMSGPTRRFLERQATYTVEVSNPGTAPARDVELVTELPRGMKFVKANNAGHYDPQTHTVTWNLEELPPAERGSVTLVAVPVEPGEQRLKIEGKARQGLSDAKEKTVLVEGLANVTFDVRGDDEAIEVGGETTYKIHVVNEGTMAATNLQVAAMFPPELKPLEAEGPARYAIDRHTVQFDTIPRLDPKGEATFQVRAKATAPGDLRVKAQVQTDDMRQPVLKEENTRVYVDE